MQKLTNHIIRYRMKDVLGEATTACASDSTMFVAIDQNFLTEWHPRYQRRGVMIYWLTDRKSACIYSQLKSCLSSELAAMMEGILRHCTDMEIDRNYVDTHGHSVVACAFSHLQPVLSRPINIGLKEMTPENFKGLSLLFYHHVNPYGIFKRIPIKLNVA
jgi:TnpA family transposase